MSGARRAIPLIERASKPRYFHTTRYFLAKPAPRRSPRVSSAKSSPGLVKLSKSYEVEESLPPLALLNSAKKSGALGVDPQRALEFLHRYQETGKKPGGGWEQQLCTRMVTIRSIARDQN